MAVSPRVTKVVQANLDRAKGIGDGLLTDPSAQAENLLRQGSNALNSGIKVIEGFIMLKSIDNSSLENCLRNARMPARILCSRSILLPRLR